jgi:hypothetical protein
MSEQARIAYQAWNSRHKVNMQVHTNEQMFIIGFDESQEIVKELSNLVLDMEKEMKRLNDQINKLKKDAKKV